MFDLEATIDPDPLSVEQVGWLGDVGRAAFHLGTAFFFEFLQMKNDAIGCRDMQVLGVPFVDMATELKRGPVLATFGVRLLEQLNHLLLAFLSVLDVLLNLRNAMVNGLAVAGIQPLGVQGEKTAQAVEVRVQVFKDGGAVAEDAVCGEEGVLLFEQESAMVGRVAGRVDDLERGLVINLKDLTVF